MTIWKAFVRPYLDYGDVIYSEAYSKRFHQKLEFIISLESIQYNACLDTYLKLLEDCREKNAILE